MVARRHALPALGAPFGRPPKPVRGGNAVENSDRLIAE
ncbi:hypothetical protein A33M_1916 [Rhodovulum sp. PH10]|nr:hypothetical protein A33M_1916 [Rhodovulum sp. PH10]